MGVQVVYEVMMVEIGHEVKPRVLKFRLSSRCAGAQPKTDPVQIAIAIREEYLCTARRPELHPGGSRRKMRAQRAVHSESGGWRVFSGAPDVDSASKSPECDMGADFQRLRMRGKDPIARALDSEPAFWVLRPLGGLSMAQSFTMKLPVLRDARASLVRASILKPPAG